MARQQFNVQFRFTGDTSQLRNELKSLKSNLESLSGDKGISLLGKMPTADLIAATNAAGKLKIALDNATNINTGKLDISAFMGQLKQTGMSLEECRISLQALGPEGSIAFAQLANSIMNAESSLFRSTTLIDKMKKSLGNVLQWNVSSTIYNTISGQIKNAFTYAQHLNKSLNDIQIVSGKNAQSMAEFAKQANKAAKALNTTTKEYAEASLIYFQQGLTDAQVEKRTDITIKMANVTGEAAEDVSSYMTAIWNNFYDGSKSLEYYADIMTALGAATASSTEEIAGGLEKFAAIADTVGLSYEYATSALATVVAETRQSEETVGTAFKTIFGRIQSLSLGETLDDGTTLTKYSSALKTVGVEIMGTNGQLRDMDNILDDLGKRWGQLDEASKVALANTLAGTRQYSNFIALMDNYDKFKINVDIAMDAEGTLNEQADIYGKSWEAAANRVKAAAETIYDNLVNSDQMIELMDWFTGILGHIDRLIDGLGGINGVLSTLALWIVKIKKEKITGFVGTLGNSIANFFAPSRVTKFRAEAQKQSLAVLSGQVTGDTSRTEELVSKYATPNQTKTFGSTRALLGKTGRTELGKAADTGDMTTGYERITVLQSKMMANAEVMTESQKQQAEMLLNRQIELEKELKIKQDIYSAQEDAYESAQEAEAKRLEELAIEEEYAARVAKAKEEADREYNEKRKQYEKEYYDYKKALEEQERLKKQAQAYDEAIGTDGIKGKAETLLATEEISDSAKQAASLTKKDLSKDDNKLQLQENLDTVLADTTGLVHDDTKTSIKEITTDEEGNAKDLSELTEKELEELRDILSSIQADAKNIIKKTKNEIETMVADAGGDVTKATSSQTLRSLAGAGGADADAAVSDIFAGGRPDASIVRVPEAPKEPEAVNPAEVDKNAVATEVKEGRKDTKGKKDKTLDKIKNLTKAKTEVKAYTKELKAQEKEEGKLNKETTAYQKLLKTLAKTYNKSEKEVDDLIDNYDDLHKLTKDLDKGTDRLIDTYKDLADASEDVDLTIKGAEELGVIAAETEMAEEATKEFGEGASEAMDDLGDKTMSVSEMVVGVGEAVLACATIIQSVKGLMDIWNDEDATTGEKLIGTITTVMALLPALSTVYGVVRKAQDAYVAGVNKKIAADAKDNVSTAVNTAGKWAQVQAMLSNPWMAAAVVAAIVAAIVIIAAVTAKDTQANLDHAESLKEDSAASQEALETRKEVIDSLREEVDAVNEAAEAYKNKTSSLEDYYDTTKDAIKAINEQIEEENKLLAENEKRSTIYLGSKDWFSIKENQESVQKKINDEYMHQLRKSVEEGQTNLSDVTKAAGYAMNYDVAINDKDNNDVEAVSNILENREKYSLLSADDEQFHVNVSESSSDEDIIKAYEQVQALKAELEASGQGDSQTAEDLKTWLSDNKEYYDNLIKAKETQESQGIELIYREKIQDMSKDELANLSLDAYVNMRDEMAAAAEELGIAREELYNYLADTELSDNEALYRHLEEIKRVTGQSMEDVIAYYNGLSATEKKAFSLIDVSDYADNELNDFADLQGRVQEYWDKYYEGQIGLAQSAAEMTDGALEYYAEAILNTTVALEDLSLAQKKALARNLEFQNGIEALSDTWEDNYYTILTAKEGTKEYSIALDNIATSLEKTLGVRVSSDWLKDENNLALLQRLLTGDVDALKEIQSSIGKDVIQQTGLDSAVQEKITQELDALGAQEANLGDSFSASGLLTNLEAAINSQELTEEEALKLLQARGYEAETTKNSDGQIKFTNLVRAVDETTIDTKLLDGEIDKTVKYERAIDRLNISLEKTQKEKDKAFGSNKIQLMEQEREKLDALIKKNNEYKDTLSSELDTSKTTLTDMLVGEDELVIDETTGEILNRNEILEKYAGNEAIVEAIEAYEEYLDQINELTEENAELQEDKIASLWEEHEYKIKLRVELKEETLEQLEWELERLEGKSYKTGEALVNIEKQVATIAADSAASINEAQGVLNLLEQKGLTLEQASSMSAEQLKEAGLTEEQIEQVKALPDTLRNNISELYDLRETYWEQIVNAIDSLNEELDTALGKFDNFTTELDTYTNIIDLVGKKSLGITNDTLKLLRDTSQLNANNQLQANRIHMQSLQEQLNTAQMQLENAKNNYDEDAVAKWQEQVNTLQESIAEANNNILASWENAIQVATDTFVQAVNLAIQDMDTALAGAFGSIQYLQSAYAQQQELSNLYLDDYRQIYELSKLTRSITSSINDTDSVKGKKELQKILTQINTIQKNGTEMSEHDLELLQKQYELRMAEMALEDAQNAKTQVRMRRDAEGNLSYVYTANQDNIDAAQQAYEDKLFAIQETNANYLEVIEGQLLESIASYQSEVQSIMEDTSLDIIEKQAKIDQLQTSFYKKQTYFSDEYNKTLSSNSELYDKDLKNYQSYAGQKGEFLTDFITQFNQSTLGQLLTGYDSIDEYTNRAIESSNILGSNLNIALTNYMNTVHAINNIAGVDAEGGQTLAEHINNQLTGENGIIKNSEEALAEVNTLGAKLSGTYEDLSLKMSNFNDEFKDLMDQVEGYSGAAIEEVQKLLRAMSNGVEIEGAGTLKFVTSFNSYDTGGYTGDWGTDGKLAILHQKELVLNASDTENILKVVDIVRQLEDYMNTYAKVRDLTLGNIQSNIATAQTLEQEVTIHADFPNVVNHSEIEQAFENIVNMASQYANRKQ